MGKMPTVYRDHDWPMYAGADRRDPSAVDDVTLKAAIAKEIEPLKAAAEKAAADLKSAQDKLASSETKLADAEKKVLQTAQDPGRKTITPAIQSLLAKSGLAAPEGDGKLEISKVDEALNKAGLTMSQRIQAKTALTRADLL